MIFKNKTALVLRKDGKDNSTKIKQAEDPSTSQVSLLTLAREGDQEVLSAMIRSQNYLTNQVIDEILRNNLSESMLLGMAQNPNFWVLSTHITSVLVESRNPSVYACIVNTSPTTNIDALLACAGSKRAKKYMASSIATTKRALKFLARDDDDDVRAQVLLHPNLPRSVQSILRKDYLDSVRDGAKRYTRNSVTVGYMELEAGSVVEID